MGANLFSEFNPVTAKQWKQQIQVDLKGDDYNNTLVYHTLEGIDIKPFYHSDETPNTTLIPGHPTQWNIAQSIYIDDIVIANKIAIDALNRGAEALLFTAATPFDIQKMFQSIPWNDQNIYFEFSFLDQEFTNSLLSYFKEINATIYLGVDPLGTLASTGNWYQNSATDHQILEQLVKSNSLANCITVNTACYQNAGATMVQQLAYAMAHTNEYLNHFFKLNEKENTPFSITFKISVGSNYFFEIAKIRALRVLYATLANAYKVSETCHILAIPSLRNKTIYDYNVNMLRTTTECMSAVLGGANTICNLPYDALYHKSNEFGERISRNQLLVLKEESYFETVSNPADGSYYIESLTQELAEKAFHIFKEIEKSGGFLAQLKAGTIQNKIKESALKEQSLFDQGKLILLGTNKHVNPMDKMKNDLELFPFKKQKSGKTYIAPIVSQRLAENVEQERLNNE